MSDYFFMFAYLVFSTVSFTFCQNLLVKSECFKLEGIVLLYLRESKIPLHPNTCSEQVLAPSFSN